MPNSETSSETDSNIEINLSKSRNLEANDEKTLVLTISAKYLCIYRMNRAIKESSARRLR